VRAPVFHCDLMCAFAQLSFIVHWMRVEDLLFSRFCAVRVDVVTPMTSTYVRV